MPSVSDLPNAGIYIEIKPLLKGKVYNLFHVKSYIIFYQRNSKVIAVQKSSGNMLLDTEVVTNHTHFQRGQYLTSFYILILKAPESGKYLCVALHFSKQSIIINIVSYHYHYHYQDLSFALLSAHEIL